MAFRNKRVANCSVCGNKIEIGQGWTEGPPWVSKCNSCSGTVENAASKVAIKVDPRGLSYAPVGYLGKDVFSKYMAAIEGASFDGKTRTNYSGLDKALKIIPALQAAGFVVDISPDAAASVQAKSAQLKGDVLAASERADKIDEELRSRGLVLFPFQKQGVAWLAGRDGALLADDMGLGKTIQTLIALPENAAVIVLAPALAKGVWQKETAKWRPDLKVTVLSGRGSFRYPAPGEMVITNYEVFSKPETGLPVAGTVLVADEAHLLKNANSKRGAAFREMSGLVRADGGKVWLLTATPIMNRPGELWSILQAAGLAQEAFGTWNNFARIFNGTQDNWGGWHWGTPLPEAAERMRRVSLRRVKSEVLDQLPAKMYRQIDVDLDAKVRKLLIKAETVLASYDRFSRINDDPKPSEVMAKHREEEQAALRDVYGDALENIEEASKIIQAVGRAGFEQLSRAREALAVAKIPAMLEVVEEYEAQEEPLVVFSDHIAPVEFLSKREGWGVITGATSHTERTRLVEEFQAGRLKGIAGTIKAMGVAITLTRASNVLFVDLNWTPVLNGQAEDRIYRIGQSRGVLVMTLVAKHVVDEHLFSLLSYKQNIITNSVEASRVSADFQAQGVAEVDFASLDAAAAEERAREEAAQKLAEERRKEFESRQAEIDEQNKEAEKKRRLQRRQERWLNEAKTEEAPLRLPTSAREHWVVESLRTLAALDPDRAKERNDAGFSASDGGIGHKYAYVAPILGLTEQQWGLAYALCCKYHRQVGKFAE